jgi:hypothetical protein
MDILKKPEPKKCKCGLPTGTSASGLSMPMGAGRTLSHEKSAMRRETDKIQLDTMKAYLRLHNAQADLAEVTAARARAELQQYLAALAKKAVRK